MTQAVGFIEAIGLAAAIEAADAAVKSANVSLLGYELSRGSGMVTVKVQGDVGAVKASIEAAKIASSKVHKVYSSLVIPRPAHSTAFIIKTEETVLDLSRDISILEPSNSEPSNEEPSNVEPAAFPLNSAPEATLDEKSEHEESDVDKEPQREDEGVKDGLQVEVEANVDVDSVDVDVDAELKEELGKEEKEEKEEEKEEKEETADPKIQTGGHRNLDTRKKKKK